MTDKSNPQSNIHELNAVYTDAPSIFAFSPCSVGEILAQGLIVMDTNALLVPYSTGHASLVEIKKTYTKLISQKRLVVPGQVAREFARNRPERLKNLYQQIAQRRQGQPRKDRYPLLAELKEYKDLIEADENVEKALDISRRATDALLKTVKTWLWNDPISSLYRELFKDGVVVDQPIDPKFDEDLQRRNAQKIPPGYKDAGKDDGGPGDLLIWHTVLHLGRTLKKHAMFVTAEEKSDWWHRSSDGPLYPRYELLEEYRSVSEGRTFHIMSFAELLEHFGAKDAVVEEVRREQIVITVPTVSLNVRQVESETAVRNWLATFARSPMENDGFQKFWIETDTGKTGVVVKLIGQRTKVLPKLEQVIRASKSLRITAKTRLIAVFVASKKEDTAWADALLKECLQQRTVKRFTVIVGYIKKGRFDEVSRIHALDSA